MSSGPRDPRAPQPPPSPDELPGGIRGRVSGVTRIGGRALAVGVVVVTALLLAILYGITKKPPERVAALPTAAPVVAPSDSGDFGQGVPVVPTTPPQTPPPPFLEPATAVPNVVAVTTAAPVAETPPTDTTVSAADSAAAQAAADEAKKLADAEKAREAALEAARRSKILIGQGVDQAGSGNGGGGSDASGVGGTQTAFTGTGDAGGANASLSGGTTGADAGGGGLGTGSSGGGSSASRGIGGNALLGRGNPSEPTPQSSDDLSYLSGPTHQYAIQRANILLPPGGNPKDFLQAQRFQPISPFQVSASSVIPAELITGISSEKTGLVSAQVREDVYDTKTGRYLLIPQGTRLVGVYQSATGYGASRISVAWQRLIFPDTTSIDLQDMAGLDTGGFTGLGGTVDNHYGKIFGAALLTSVLAAGVALSSGQQSQSVLYPSAAQQASQQIAQNVLNIGTTITNKALSIPPTVYVARGYPFLVFVDRDIVFPGPYGSGL